MSVQHPKLHIVLTAKAKHAEFKCPLCKKLFISAYHLNRHKSRRHSHYCENIKGHEQMVQYRNALQERIRSRQAVNASHRMEKLLRNLSLEGTQLFDKSKQLNRTSFTDIDQFPCVSVLSPINSNTNILENNAIKKIKATGGSDNIKCKENNESTISNHVYTWVTSRHLGSGDGREVCFYNEKASQTEDDFKGNKMLNDFLKDDKLISHSLVKGTQTDEADIGFISRLENVFTGNVDSVNKPSSIFDSFVNSDKQNESIVTTASISTQTDEIVYKQSCTYTQTCRSFDIYDENRRPTFKMNDLKKHITELRENALNCNKSQEIEKNNVENVLDHSVVISYSSNLRVTNGNEIASIIDKDYLTFEREFQESFDARKNLLEKDDLMFYNGNLNNSLALETQCEDKPRIEIEQVSDTNISLDGKLESKVQDSFEAKKNRLLKDHLIVEKMESTENEGADLKCPSESIEKSDSPITKISVSSNSANNESNLSDVNDPEIKNNQEDLSIVTEKRHEDFLRNIKDELSERLRSLGVDPEWSGISDIVAQKTNAILTVRRINLSKKIPRFMSMRTMLNNTIDQILEAKDCG